MAFSPTRSSRNYLLSTDTGTDTDPLTATPYMCTCCWQKYSVLHTTRTTYQLTNDPGLAQTRAAVGAVAVAVAVAIVIGLVLAPDASSTAYGYYLLRMTAFFLLLLEYGVLVSIPILLRTTTATTTHVRRRPVRQPTACIPGSLLLSTG